MSSDVILFQGAAASMCNSLLVIVLTTYDEMEVIHYDNPKSTEGRYKNMLIKIFSIAGIILSAAARIGRALFLQRTYA